MGIQGLSMDLLRSLGEFAISAGLLAWLVKSLVGAFLSKDLETHKSKLQSQSQAEIERLKATLSIAAQRQATEFSALHAKRAELLAELYSLLLDLELAVGVLTIRLDHVAAVAIRSRRAAESGAVKDPEAVEPSLGSYEKALVRKVEDAYMAFMTCFKPARIYLSDELCSSIQKGTANAARFSIDFERLAGILNELSATELMEKAATLVSLSAEWNVSLKLIEGEFRGLLGAGGSGSTAPAA